MKILVVEPLMKPMVRLIDDSLKSMQMVVGGTIQALYPFDDGVALVVNDDGKILKLPLNRALRDEAGEVYDIISGTFFICGLSEDSFTSLTDEQVARYTRKFYFPEMFMRINGRIITLQMTENEEDNHES